MKNTTKHQLDLFKFLAVCVGMRYGQETCLKEILIRWYVHTMELFIFNDKLRGNETNRIDQECIEWLTWLLYIVLRISEWMIA